VPKLTVPHLGVPHLGVPHLGVPYLGVPYLGVPYLGVPYLGVPYLIAEVNPRESAKRCIHKTAVGRDCHHLTRRKCVRILVARELVSGTQNTSAAWGLCAQFGRPREYHSTHLP
jgi:hypothetical protein